jgi:hypothetical protein
VDELEELRKQLEEVTELYHLQSQRAADYAGAFMRSKREWQGLTDEEYEAIRAAGEFGKGSLRFKNIFNAIEAKLKEKNT